MRISGGRLAGRRLQVPSDARPTAARTRQALLDRWRDRLPDARFLDLFAGSGAVGLEALSLGARELVLVESDRRAVRQLRSASRELGVEEQVRIVTATLPGELADSGLSTARSFDLIFADPPYDYRLYRELLQWAEPFLAPGGEMALEHSARVELPMREGGLSRWDSRRYGDHRLSFYRPGQPREPAAG